MYILEIAFNKFFTNTRQLIAEGIRQDINYHISNPPSDDNFSDPCSHMKDCKTNLKRWIKLDKPLTYGYKDTNKTFETLLQAVVTDKEDIVHGITPYKPKHNNPFCLYLLSHGHILPTLSCCCLCSCLD